MLVKRVIIRNVKSYYPEETVIFDEKLNIFVGTNGGGKSNLFEILQGVINNIFFRHVDLQLNGDRNNIASPNKGKDYNLVFTQIQSLNIQSTILDKNFG